MVMDGASSGRIEIGYEGILGSTLAVLKVKEEKHKNFVFYYLKSKEDDIKANTTGTSIPHTDKQKVQNYKFYLPDNDLLKRFQRESSVLQTKIINIKETIYNLQETRDSLLPKLMTGKIRVPLEVQND